MRVTLLFIAGSPFEAMEEGRGQGRVLGSESTASTKLFHPIQLLMFMASFVDFMPDVRVHYVPTVKSCKGIESREMSTFVRTSRTGVQGRRTCRLATSGTLNSFAALRSTPRSGRRTIRPSIRSSGLSDGRSRTPTNTVTPSRLRPGVANRFRFSTHSLFEHPEPRARSARGGECAMLTPRKKFKLSKTSKTYLERVN